MITLAYSCGLPVGEVINLAIQDIDSQRMIIHIRQSKGAKDRLIPLNPEVLKLLRNYYKRYQPKTYLFNGQNNLKYSATSINKVLQRAAKAAGINKPIRVHTLRHSYATHLLEKGVNLRYIKELLGHNSFITTEIYTHVAQHKLQEIGSPIEDLNINW